MDDRIHLNYLVHGDDTPDYYPVLISRTETVLGLKTLIRHQYLEEEGYKLNYLSLYKVDEPVEDLENIPVPPKNTRLKAGALLETIWPSDEELSRKRVHVLVTARDREARSREPHPEEEEVLSELPSIFKRLEIRQDAMTHGFKTGKSASEAAFHTEFARQQANDEIAIFNSRPFQRTELPVQLYHPVFDIFTKELDTTDELSASTFTAVEQLLHTSQAIYPKEDERWEAMRPHLISALGCSIPVVQAPKCKANGVVLGTGPETEAYCAIIEVKNEIGTGQSDPSIQGAESYAIYWCQDILRGLRQISCCPSFILAIAGPWMCILGAVYLDKVVVQPLTDYLWLAHHPQQGCRFAQLARVFRALSVSLSHLRRYYASLHPPTPGSTDMTRFFPYVRQFQGPDNKTVDFIFENPLGVQSMARPVFKASSVGGDDLVVKFTERYNVEAHNLLAAAGLAPRLLFDGGQELYGGLRMIVMEYLDGMDLYDYIEHHRGRKGSKENELVSVRNDVQKALSILHEHDMVFGDLRMPNVFVAKLENGETHGMLVDFDWCGKHNEVRYPAAMNDVDIRWPKGAEKGGRILKQHDLEMFENMFGKL